MLKNAKPHQHPKPSNSNNGKIWKIPNHKTHSRKMMHPANSQLYLALRQKCNAVQWNGLFTVLCYGTRMPARGQFPKNLFVWERSDTDASLYFSLRVVKLGSRLWSALVTAPICFLTHTHISWVKNHNQQKRHTTMQVSCFKSKWEKPCFCFDPGYRKFQQI